MGLRSFRDLVFFSLLAIPLWPSVSGTVVFLRVLEETALLPWPCSCQETEAWRPEVDCMSKPPAASQVGD